MKLFFEQNCSKILVKFYYNFINFLVKPSKTIYEKDNSSEMFEKFEKTE